MKTFNTILSAIAIVILCTTAAMAQGQASISATANVVTDVALSGVRNLDFGTLTDGDADGGSTIAVTTANEATLGKFAMTSLAGTQDIVLTLSAPSTLTAQASPDLSAGTAQDALPYSVAASYTETDLDPDAGTSFTTSFSTTTGAVTSAYVYVGGTIGGVAGNYQGQYSGDITLSVYYD